MNWKTLVLHLWKFSFSFHMPSRFLLLPDAILAGSAVFLSACPGHQYHFASLSAASILPHTELIEWIYSEFFEKSDCTPYIFIFLPDIFQRKNSKLTRIYILFNEWLIDVANIIWKIAFLQPTVELRLLTPSPDLFARPAWTSQNLFSSQTYLLFHRVPGFPALRSGGVGVS